MNETKITARHITYTALIAAAYAVSVLALAPISFGPLQFRAATMLKALAILRPEFAVGFAIGNSIANHASPFGFWDWLIMPIFDLIGAYTAWKLRRYKPAAIIAQSLIIATAVATFPLGLGGGLPWLPSFACVLITSLVAIAIGTITLLPTLRTVIK